MLQQIINGVILTPSGWLREGSIVTEDNKIIDVLRNTSLIEGADVIDAKGQYVVPGAIDIHIHGGGGADFQDTTEEAFRTAIETHRRHGTTAFMPTLSSSSKARIEAAAETCQRLMQEPNSPILGLHLEGPYFNPKKAGGQEPGVIRLPDRDEYIELIERFPCIKRWDAAPELDGAMEFGRYASEHGVLVGLAHTTADAETVRRAYDNGYTHATHFYNAMTSIHKEGMYKHDGTVEGVYLVPDMTVEMIADGIHSPPTVLQLIYNMKGVERTALITDALACTDSADGRAFDPRVVIEDGVCVLKDHTALAGSIATTDRMIRTIVGRTNIPLEDAIRMASETPARILGVFDRKGSIEKGKDADLWFFTL